MEFLKGFLVTDIYCVSDYKLPKILLLRLFHKLRGLGHDDSAKAPVKIPSKLNCHCPMRITPIRFFLINCNFLLLIFSKIQSALRVVVKASESCSGKSRRFIYATSSVEYTVSLKLFFIHPFAKGDSISAHDFSKSVQFINK